MRFRYDHVFTLMGCIQEHINYLYNNTGYGALCKNYNLALKYSKTESYNDLTIDIVQCDFCKYDPNEQNCFVIFLSDYLPSSFILTINTKRGYILVNSLWMKDVVLALTNCDPSRIIKLPYLLNFDKLNKYKRVNVQKDTSKLTFYTIADYKDVKNLLSLFDAFNIAFEGQDDVELIIKTSNALFLLKGLYNRRNKYPKITIINAMLPEVELYKLHMKGDVYISTAYCVGWLIPPFQASYFGKPLICGNHSAFTLWVDFDKAIALLSYKKLVLLKLYSNGRFRNKHSAGWMVNMILTDEIIDKLKYAYNNYSTIKSEFTDVSKFDVKNIDYFILK